MEEHAEGKIGVQEYSKLVGDKYTLRILAATFAWEKNPQQLSIECDIPIAACYRRVNMLEKIGLLKCVGSALTQRGKRVRLYLSCVRKIHTYFENCKMRVKLDMNDLGGECIDTSWDVLSSKTQTYQPLVTSVR
jgi:predicted transcriptional regulator